MNTSDGSHLNFSSESAFSIAENRLDEIEAEVQKQGKAIEKYIKNHSTVSNEPEHFFVLRTLYKLFKEQVHLNIQIRKQISESIPNQKIIVSENQRISEILNGFVRDFNLHFKQSCNDLNDITQFFLDHIDNSLEIEKQSQIVRFSSQKAKNLKSQIEEYELSINNSYKKIKEYKESASMALVDINSNIENNKMSCSTLQKQIESEQRKNDEIMHKIDLINQKSSVYVKQIDYQRNNFELMINNFNEKQKKRKDKLQKLDQELNESKKKYNCLVQNVDKLKKALFEAQREKDLIEKKAKEEIAELIQQGDVFNVLISEIIENKSKNVTIKEDLTHQKQGIEKEIHSIDKKISKIEFSIAEWKAKLKTKSQMKQYIFDDIDNQTQILMKIRDECQTDDIDSYLEMKQKENEILLTENKKLESKLRITLKNIQNIQNENQDLKAKILLFNKENNNNNDITHEET